MCAHLTSSFPLHDRQLVTAYKVHKLCIVGIVGIREKSTHSLTRLPVPLPVVVVAHDVDKVEAAIHGGHVVGHVDGAGGGADGRRQEEPGAARVERLAQVADEQGKVVPVLREATAFTCIKKENRIVYGTVDYMASLWSQQILCKNPSDANISIKPYNIAKIESCP